MPRLEAENAFVPILWPAPPAHSFEPRAERAPRTRLDGIRVLVVEDDPDALDVVTTLLERAGANVRAVSSAGDALDEKGPFDVIVSDIGMPVMDGYAMMRALRGRERDGRTPAIALTAFTRREDVERAHCAGFQEHLAKPIEPAKLIAAVERLAHQS
jgi:CheY-like chemotaxis protein